MDTTGTVTKCFERKNIIWISGEVENKSADIILPIGDIVFRLEGDILESSISDKQAEVNMQRGEIVFYLNNTPVYGGTVQISKGDIIYLCNYYITFFDNHIELTGDMAYAEVRLLESEGDKILFDGYPYYNKSPRIIYKIEKEKIDIKQPPQKRVMSGTSLAQMIIPSISMAAFTVLIGIFLKTGPYMYMSMGMTIITVIFSVKNYFSEKKETKKENKLREEFYHKYLLEERAKIRAIRSEEREALDYIAPDALSIENGIRYFNNRLYERNIMDDDFLTVCLGYRNGQSDIEVTYTKDDIDPKEDILVKKARELVCDYKEIPHRPVCVNLRKANLGIVGNAANVHEQLKLLMQQITFFQSYHELEVVFIHDKEYADEFRYMRWYPHMRIHSINIVGEIYGNNGKELLNNLQQVLKEREQKVNEKKEEKSFKPHYLFIIDEPRLIMNHPIMEFLQKKVLNMGYSIIYTTELQANLPDNMNTIWIIDNSESSHLLLEEGKRKNILFNHQHIQSLDLEWEARILASIVHEEAKTSNIPESISFFDMYGVKRAEELRSDYRWKVNESHKSLAVPLGLRSENDIVYLNLHEKAHGPHGLVAGTTGSGKSEIIQSYILSLAVNFHPHEVGFLLIDYKGGGMANLFRNLPHLLGTITNLDKSESMRAMSSVKSELARRQRIFSECNVNHINGYSSLFKMGRVLEPLPHLFIISDEFAELKKEQSEFMDELISTARIGRSLGIHLILATQKPSGVVDDQIWTNSKFKLCLKVQDEGDSREMLKTPDAANITQTGRAYLQVGNNEIYELFQSAWSGAEYSENDNEEEREDDRVWVLNELGQGRLLNKNLDNKTDSNKLKHTQLDMTVKYLQSLYEKENAVKVKKTWLPPLSEHMISPYTGNVCDSAIYRDGDYKVSIGMVDIPEQQIQQEYTINLVHDGNVIYMASSGYGKSIFVSNVLISLAIKNSVRNLNYYILDMGNSALIPLKMLPHTSDYMGMDDIEKISKFMNIIEQEVLIRKKKFAQVMAQNITVYNEMCEPDDRLKVIIIAIDNYDAIRDVDDEIETFIQKIARDGVGLGIYLITTLTRTGAMRLSVLNNFKIKIAGYNYDDTENNMLIGRSEMKIPEDKKGRVLVKLENVNVMQLYTAVSCDNEIIYMDKLKKLIKEISDCSTEDRAEGIPVLPDELSMNEIKQYPEYRNAVSSEIPIGIETENLHVKYFNINIGAGLIIGEYHTGKTNLLKNIISYLDSYEVYIFDNSSMELLNYKSHDNIHYGADKDSYENLIDDIRSSIEKRKEDYEEEKLEHVNMTPREYVSTISPVYIVVDNIQQVYDVMENADIAEQIDIIAEAKEWGMMLIIASGIRIQSYKSNLHNLIGSLKTGIVLGSIRDQDQFSTGGIREDNHDIRFGYLCTNGNVEKLMLPRNEEG